MRISKGSELIYTATKLSIPESRPLVSESARTPCINLDANALAFKLKRKDA